MQRQPDDLTREMLLDILHRRWTFQPAELVYAPVGHGSHHWIGSDPAGPRWFVSADRLGQDQPDRFEQLTNAASTARQLVDDGYEFVVAPLHDASGALVRRAFEHWAIQVSPYIHGWSTDQGMWTDPDEHQQVARMVGRLHRAEPPDFLPDWEYTLPGRATIEAVLGELQTPWTAGPYAERARALLADSHTAIRNLLTRYDQAAGQIKTDNDPWVLTHGEPDSDNIIRANTGQLYLIDWTTAKRAPRERDLLDVIPGPADVLPAYQDIAGPYRARPAGLELFRLWWAIHEISLDIRRFRQPHPDNDAMKRTWNRLKEALTA